MTEGKGGAMQREGEERRRRDGRDRGVGSRQDER